MFRWVLLLQKRLYTWKRGKEATQTSWWPSGAFRASRTSPNALKTDVKHTHTPKTSVQIASKPSTLLPMNTQSEQPDHLEKLHDTSVGYNIQCTYKFCMDVQREGSKDDKERNWLIKRESGDGESRKAWEQKLILMVVWVQLLDPLSKSCWPQVFCTQVSSKRFVQEGRQGLSASDVPHVPWHFSLWRIHIL